MLSAGEDSGPVQDHGWSRIGGLAQELANQEALSVGSDIVGAEDTAGALLYIRRPASRTS